MTKKPPTNFPASIHQKLLNKARSETRPFNELLQYYGMERFLYRLSESPHAQRFVLKGALMLRVWGSPETRPTRDIDLLGKTSHAPDRLTAQMLEVLGGAVPEDGILFDLRSLQAETITQEAEYEGVRLKFLGFLGAARIPMQIDVGFADPVFPEPQVQELPTLLALPAPRLLCYSRESAVAEKFHAMVLLGELNSRMKDFYDIWLLSGQFPFEGKVLAEAVRLTFEHRATTMPDEVVAFSSEFADARQVQWAAFRKRMGQDNIPERFAEVVTSVRAFLLPILHDVLSSHPSAAHWHPPGPWLA